VPIVSKTELELADVNEKDVDFLLPDGSLRQGVHLPLDEPELVEQIRANFKESQESAENITVMVTVIKACGKEKIVEVRKK
jgi:hypothetical protein